MSGGLFDYKDLNLKDEIFGWNREKGNVFEDKEITELIYDVFGLIHEFDWYQSGDTDEGDYFEAKRNFKEKWFETPAEIRVQKIIDNSVEELREELYKTFDVNKTFTNTVDEDEVLRRKLFASLNGGRYE